MKKWNDRIKFSKMFGFDSRNFIRNEDFKKRNIPRTRVRLRALDVESARLSANANMGGENKGEGDVKSVATQLRETLVSLLNAYETSHGSSCDAYCADSRWHAMAEAQYLEAVVTAHSTGVLSQSRAKKLAVGSVDRLRAGALCREAGIYALWGLGFQWKGNPPSEPYLVTTALVTRALSAAHDLGESTSLAREGLAGLSLLPHQRVATADYEFRAPVYSESINEIVENTIGIWAQTILKFQNVLLPKEETIKYAESSLLWIERRYIKEVGWIYSEDRKIVDLLHQTYILESLMSFSKYENLEVIAIETLASFRAGDSYIDSMEITDLTEGLATTSQIGNSYLAFRGGMTLKVKSGSARLWSLGGMLSVFGLFALRGNLAEYWLRQIRTFPFHLLPKQFGQDFRQEMHLARGLALSLLALRERS